MTDERASVDAGSADASRNWLRRVRVVLIGTSHAGNVGAVARAMKNMGLSRLVLVSPQAEVDEKAYANAKHAREVLDEAVICHDLEEALAGSISVWATSARPRGMNLPMADVRTSVAEMRRALGETAGDGDVSILFGAERTGLTNAELLMARSLIEIPANPDYPVLNLAQAVQVICYEMQLAARERAVATDAREGMEAPACIEAIGGLVDRLGGLLDDRGYFGPADSLDESRRARERLLGRVRLLLNRAGPSANELAILHGMLTALGRGSDNESRTGAVGDRETAR